MNGFGRWDTAGQDDFEKMRPLCYENVDVFLVMFSIASMDSYRNVATKWFNEVNRAKTSEDVPVILVGTKSDVRADAEFLRSIAPQEPVTFKEGKKLAKDIGAISYLECSAIQGVGFEDIFAQCIAAIINARIMHKDVSKFCYHTTCSTKLSVLKKKKCVRCQHYFCPAHVNTLPKGHDYSGKNICHHCADIDQREPLKLRQKISVLAAPAEKKSKKKVAAAKPDSDGETGGADGGAGAANGDESDGTAAAAEGDDGAAPAAVADADGGDNGGGDDGAGDNGGDGDGAPAAAKKSKKNKKKH